jgi:Zn-finger nucleic acid-binding protein
MNCPVDGTSLQMTERQGVEIDYCPRCRGVWLDRGELDKIIERSAAVERAPEGPFYAEPRDTHRDREHWDDDDDDRGRHGRPRRKRGSFLEDLFDF